MADPLDVLLAAPSARALAVELGWEPDPRWADPTGKERKKYVGTGPDHGKKPRYQKSVPGSSGRTRKPAGKPLRVQQLLDRDRRLAEQEAARQEAARQAQQKQPPAPVATPLAVPEAKPLETPTATPLDVPTAAEHLDDGPGVKVRDRLIGQLAAGGTVAGTLDVVLKLPREERVSLAEAMGVDPRDAYSISLAISVRRDRQTYRRNPDRAVAVPLTQQDPDHPAARRIAGDRRALDAMAEIRGRLETVNDAGVAEHRRLREKRRQRVDVAKLKPAERLEYEAEEARFRWLDQELKKANAGARQALQEVLKPARPFAPKIVTRGSYQRGATAASQKAFRRGIDFVRSICADRGAPVRVELEVPHLDPWLIQASQQGAYRRMSYNPANLFGRDRVSVVSPGIAAGFAGEETAEAVILPQAIHAMGYVLEASDPEIRRRTWEFLDYRTGRMSLFGEWGVDMRSRYPNGGYWPDARAHKDSFDRHFDEEAAYNVGLVDNKVTTNVLAMGLEALYKDPLGFMRNDPEYAAFVIGLLQGQGGVEAGTELATTPPDGYEPVKGSRKGGYRKAKPGGGYDYWYPAGGGTESERGEAGGRAAVARLVAGHPVSRGQAKDALAFLSRLSLDQVARLRSRAGLRLDPATARRVGVLTGAALARVQGEGRAAPVKTGAGATPAARKVLAAVEADGASRELVARLAGMAGEAAGDRAREGAIGAEMQAALGQLNGVPAGFDWGSKEGRLLNATVSATIEKAEAALADIHAADGRRRKAARRILTVPDPTPVTATVAGQVPEAVLAAAEGALAWLGDILAAAPAEAEFEHAPGERAGLYNERTIRMDDTDGPDVVIHELGHALEHQVPGIGRAVRAYLAHRCGDEAFVSIREATGSAFYDEDERGRKDDFEEAFGPSAWYVGKVYPDGATELLAMGLQMLYLDAPALAAADPELCAFLVGVLHGRIRLGEDADGGEGRGG